MKISSDLKRNFKFFCLKNILVFIYLFLLILIEVVSISFIGCSPFLTKPLYFMLLIGLILSLLFLIPNIHVKYVICCALLILQGIMNISFVYLYDSNGTFFEWSMFSQRNDGFGTIEDLSLRWGLLAFIIVMIVLYVVAIILLCLLFYKKKKFVYKSSLATKIVTALVLVACTLSIVLSPVIDAVNSSKLSYKDRYLYGPEDNRYQQLGITSNTIYEFFNGTVADALVKHDDKGIDEYLDNNGDKMLEQSEYFGISRGNNLVYILVESFEWYSFLTNCTKEQSLYLYPNLNKFLNNSIYADNFYAREKTDTAEMLALVGSNPSDKYINYAFENNDYPYSMPNMFKQGVEDSGNTVKQVASFHQNKGTTYNRRVLHKSLGFDKSYFIEDMEDYGVVNQYDAPGSIHERTLDSTAVEKMQDVMFPMTQEGEQYMSFYLTFTMHGFYVHRTLFEEQGYYDKLDEVGAYPEGKSTKDDYLRTYAAAVMDFDKAVGIMMDKLEANGQLDNTTIVLFADHNTYYSNLSYHAKGIKERFNSELYRVPFMMYDQKVKQAYEANEGTRAISKFTTTADMLPTLLDIFGIHGYKNLYFGSSMFLKDTESIIYSRAYRIFVTDKLICYSVNYLLYKCEGFTEADKQSFIDRAEIHLNKLEYIDKIFYHNYFANHEYVRL